MTGHVFGNLHFSRRFSIFLPVLPHHVLFDFQVPKSRDLWEITEMTRFSSIVQDPSFSEDLDVSISHKTRSNTRHKDLPSVSYHPRQQPARNPDTPLTSLHSSRTAWATVSQPLFFELQRNQGSWQKRQDRQRDPRDPQPNAHATASAHQHSFHNSSDTCMRACTSAPKEMCVSARFRGPSPNSFQVGIGTKEP